MVVWFRKHRFKAFWSFVSTLLGPELGPYVEFCFRVNSDLAPFKEYSGIFHILPMAGMRALSDLKENTEKYNWT